MLFTLEEFSEASQETSDAFRLYQKAKDDYEILKDSKKDFLALCMTQVPSDGERLSESSRERLARISDEWLVFMQGEQEAVRGLGRAGVQYFNALRKWETIRSGLSYKKAELKGLGLEK